MESISLKSIIIGVLMLGLVLQQTHIEAKSCCCSTTTRNCYNVCRVTGSSRPTCASLCGCKILEKCVPPCDRFNLVTDANEAKSIEFCKLGCMSSLCENINAVVASQEVKDVKDHCKTGCYHLCTKDYEFGEVLA
uniref:Acidic protein n=1 Tax=Hordeum vulgare subsp. vulgare TaxID=112509 RepID=A0A8I6YYX1_HORVV